MKAATAGETIQREFGLPIAMDPNWSGISQEFLPGRRFSDNFWKNIRPKGIPNPMKSLILGLLF